MSVYTKCTRVLARVHSLKKCSVGKFLNGQCVQGVQAKREFHVSHSSAIFVKEIFVGNFVKVYYVLLHFVFYHCCLIPKNKVDKIVKL